MPALTTIIYNYVNSKKFYIWVALFLVLISIAVFYAFKYLYNPSQVNNKYKNVANMPKDGNSAITVYFFFADWCPHCRAAKPEWNIFQSEYNGKTVNDKIIHCEMVDCSDGTDERISKYDIQGFPTVKMINGADVIDFDSKVTSSALEKFVNNMA